LEVDGGLGGGGRSRQGGDQAHGVDEPITGADFTLAGDVRVGPPK
jgi:hypothetical protein